MSMIPGVTKEEGKKLRAKFAKKKLAKERKKARHDLLYTVHAPETLPSVSTMENLAGAKIAASQEAALIQKANTSALKKRIFSMCYGPDVAAPQNLPGPAGLTVSDAAASGNRKEVSQEAKGFYKRMAPEQVPPMYYPKDPTSLRVKKWKAWTADHVWYIQETDHEGNKLADVPKKHMIWWETTRSGKKVWKLCSAYIEGFCMHVGVYYRYLVKSDTQFPPEVWIRNHEQELTIKME